MFIHEFCAAWLDHPFWRPACLLDDPQDLQQIVDSDVKEVVIDISRGEDVAQSRSAQAFADKPQGETPRQPSQTPVRTSMREELAQARKIYSRSTKAVVSMFSEARMGKAVSAESAMPLVLEISDSVERNPSAFISLARLKTADACGRVRTDDCAGAANGSAASRSQTSRACRADA